MDRFKSDPDKYMFYKKYEEKAGVEILDDFLRLNVYWLTNKGITTEESALYGPRSLISDIGGQFGIWIRVSVITLSELPSLWRSGIGSRLGRNRSWVRFLTVSDIYPMFIEPTITWVLSGFSGYIWLDTKIVLTKKNFWNW